MATTNIMVATFLSPSKMTFRVTPESIARKLLLACLFAPLIVLPGFFFPFIGPRAVFFRVLVELALGILVWLLFTRRFVMRARHDYFLWALLFFTFVAALSAAAGPARNHSFFGDLERMGGVWATMHLLAFYVLLRVFLSKEDWINFFRAASLVGGLVSLLAVLQSFHPAATNGEVSTIGNPSLLGAYLIFPTLCSFLCFKPDASRGQIAFWLLIGFLNFTGIILSQNRSTLGGLILGAVLGAMVFGLLVHRLSRKAIILSLGGLASVLLAGTLIFAFRAKLDSAPLPGVLHRILATDIAGKDAERPIQWRAASRALTERPILGYGPENYHLVWSANFDPEMYDYSPDRRWDRAHSVFMEALSTTGILGVLAFAGLWIALIAGIFRARRTGFPPIWAAALTTAFTGYLFWLAFWFFDLNSEMLWVAGAAFLFSAAAPGKLVELEERVLLRTQSKWILGLGGLTLVASLYLHGYETMRLARLLHRTLVNDVTTAERLGIYLDAFDSPAPQTSHTFYLYGQFMASLAPDFDNLRKDPSLQKLMDTAFTRGLVEFERERERDPLNEFVYIHQARLGLLAASYYKQSQFYDYSIKSINRAIALNPKRLQPRVLLGYVLTMAKNYDGARRELEKARAVYARSGQIYYYLANLDLLQGNLFAAAAQADTASQLHYSGEFTLYLELVAKLEKQNERVRAAKVMESYLDGRLPKPDPARPLVKLKHTYDKSEMYFLGRLPIKWLIAGDVDRSIAAATRLAKAYPRSRRTTSGFIADLKQGATDRWKDSTSLTPPSL